MRWQDIAGLTPNELNRLDAQTLRKYTTQLVSAANKRLRNLRKRGLETPATIPLEGGRFATPRKTNLKRIPPEERRNAALQDVNRLREELSRVKRFMVNETSTVRGYTEFNKRKIARLLGEKPLTDEELEKETPKERRERKKRERENERRFRGFNWSTFYAVVDRVKRFNPVLGSERVRQIVFDIVSNAEDMGDVEELVKLATERLEREYRERQNEGPTDGYTRVM